MDVGEFIQPGVAVAIALGLGREVRAMRRAMEEGFSTVATRFNALEGRVVNLEKPKSGPPVKGFASVMLVLVMLLASCRVPAPDVPKSDPVHPRDATVFIHMTDTVSGDEGYATGWYIASDGDTAVVATAGHVCDPGQVYGISDGVGLTDEGLLTDERAAFPFYDRDDAPTNDVCLLAVPGAGPVAVLEVAEVSPAADDEVHYTGYPSGTRGSYKGTVEDVASDGVLLLNIAGYRGASGSAVVNSDGRVVGILSMGDMRFTNHIWLTGTAAVNRAKIVADDYLWSI